MGITINTAVDIEKMRIAGKLAAAVLHMIKQYVRPGVSTNTVNELCHKYIVEKQQATPATLGYRGFPKSICTSVNQEVCHGIPGERILRKGDIVNIDVTIIKDGYHGDTSQTFIVGKSSILAKRLVDVTQECLYRGIRVVKPGAHLGDIGAAVQEHARIHNFSVVREYCGHGIGKLFHEAPDITHFGQAGTGLVIQEGMIFTIEPMLNVGSAHVKCLSDGWTVVTRDHSLSAQWEHTVLVTANGVEVLTQRPDEVIP